MAADWPEPLRSPQPGAPRSEQTDFIRPGPKKAGRGHANWFCRSATTARGRQRDSEGRQQLLLPPFPTALFLLCSYSMTLAAQHRLLWGRPKWMAFYSHRSSEAVKELAPLISHHHPKTQIRGIAVIDQLEVIMKALNQYSQWMTKKCLTVSTN